MEHAAGADHLIYGWFFFAFVIVCLLGIGELIRESVASKNQKFKNVEINNEKTTTIIATLLLVVGVLWNVLIGQPKTINDRPDLAVIDHLKNTSCRTLRWKPMMHEPDSEINGLINTDCSVNVYLLGSVKPKMS